MEGELNALMVEMAVLELMQPLVLVPVTKIVVIGIRLYRVA